MQFYLLALTLLWWKTKLPDAFYFLDCWKQMKTILAPIKLNKFVYFTYNKQMKTRRSLSIVSQPGATYSRSWKFLKKESVSQLTWNTLKCIEMQKKIIPLIYCELAQCNFITINRLEVHTFSTKLDQNPTNSKRDISRKSGTDRQTDRQTHR